MEEDRILERLILTLCGREQHHTDLFTEIVARRADEVPNILNKEVVDLLQIPARCSNMLTDPRRLKMAVTVSLNLPHCPPTPSETTGIVVRLQITYKGGGTYACGDQHGQGALQEGGFTRARARNQVERYYSGCIETRTESCSRLIILAQHTRT